MQLYDEERESMAMTKDQILTEAMALEPRERDEVAEALWQCIVPEEFTPGQVAEVRRRIAALDNGEVEPLPGEQVMQELRQRFQR
jgi:putative addiction module component (TIGR02574 family)